MDDKLELAMLMKRVAGSLEGIDKAVSEIQEVLQTMRERSEAELKQRVAQLNAVTSTQKYTSGRWTRRDGDIFGMTPGARNNVPPEIKTDGDGSSGNL